jgi:SAM-dependent methyltransferase
MRQARGAASEASGARQGANGRRPGIPAGSKRPQYGGVDNLEVMEGAHRYRAFLVRAVTDAVGPPERAGRLLDFGCGTGTIAKPLRDLGYQVECLEPDTSMRDALSADGFAVAASLEGHAPASLDGVYSMNVLEHIDDDAGALASIHRVTRPGGRLVLYVPALQSLYSAMDRKVGHLRRYRRQPLEQLVRGAGFRVDWCRYVDVLGVPAGLAYKAFGSRRGDLGAGSVVAYDRMAFPVSRVLDRLTSRVVGKNLLLLGTRP